MIFRFIRIATRAISYPSRPTQRGVGQRRERRTGCGGRGGAFDERYRSVRQRRVVLTPQMLASSLADARSDGGNRAWAHRGERAISRKAIAQGMADCLR